MSDKSIDHPANGSKEREIELGGVVASLRRHATHGWLACPLPSTHTRTKHTKRIAVLIPKVGHFYIAFLSMKKNLFFFSSSLLQKDRTYKYIGDTHTEFCPKKGESLHGCCAVNLAFYPPKIKIRKSPNLPYATNTRLTMDWTNEKAGGIYMKDEKHVGSFRHHFDKMAEKYSR